MIREEDQYEDWYPAARAAWEAGGCWGRIRPPITEPIKWTKEDDERVARLGTLAERAVRRTLGRLLVPACRRWLARKDHLGASKRKAAEVSAGDDGQWGRERPSMPAASDGWGAPRGRLPGREDCDWEDYVYYGNRENSRRVQVALEDAARSTVREAAAEGVTIAVVDMSGLRLHSPGGGSDSSSAGDS